LDGHLQVALIAAEGVGAELAPGVQSGVEVAVTDRHAYDGLGATHLAPGAWVVVQAELKGAGAVKIGPAAAQPALVSERIADRPLGADQHRQAAQKDEQPQRQPDADGHHEQAFLPHLPCSSRRTYKSLATTQLYHTL
jgi:hypothetical protein